MNIGVDIRSLLAMSRGGIPHYTHSIVRELIRRYPDDRWRLLVTGRRPYALPPELRAPNVTLHHLRRPNRLVNAGLALTGRPRLDRVVGGVDVWFAPGFGFLRFSRAVPLVLTVHDLSFRSHPEWYGPRSRLWHRLVRPRATVRRAARLIAVSAQTRRELETAYAVPRGRVRVIYPGIDEVYRQPVSRAACARVRRKYRLPKSYLLSLGALERRKNLPTLLRAYQAARAAGLASGLVLAGRGTEHWPVPAEQLKDVLRLGYVPDADLPALYAEARAVVLVSWYEGFGFPPLEALAVGTPSLVSDLPIFAETLGAAAVRVAPDNPAALADSLVQLDHDANLRRRLATRGAARLNRFSWERAARETYRVLREVADAR